MARGILSPMTTAHRHLAYLLLLLLAALLLSGCGGGRWITLTDPYGLEEVVAGSNGAKVVVVGEFHNRRRDHEIQLALIRSLHGRGVPLAVGLEMFDTESQPYLDRWVEGKMDLQEFQEVYHRNWNINWPEYDTILLYARQNRIPLLGLNAPPDIATRVLHSGFAALDAADRARLPEGVTVATTESYRSFLGDAFDSHPLPQEAFATFCEAQALRNSTMARRIASYAAAHPERTVVVITGIGHAIRRGLGEELRVSGLSSRTIIPVADAAIFERLRRDDADYFVTSD